MAKHPDDPALGRRLSDTQLADFHGAVMGGCIPIPPEIVPDILSDPNGPTSVITTTGEVIEVPVS